LITPHPETDLNQNTMVLGAEVLEILKKAKGELLVDELLVRFMKKNSKFTPDQFMETLIFLYSLGAIEKNQFKVKVVKRVNA